MGRGKAMKTYTQFNAPGRMRIVAVLKSPAFHALPGAMPSLAVWLRLPPLEIITFCLTSLALSNGFYRYQRWDVSRIQDWSFIQWGEFVARGFIRARGMLLLPLILPFF